MNKRKILGWGVLLPRLVTMIAASISMYHASLVHSMIGIIASIVLGGLYLLDVIYLTIVLIHDLIKKDDSWSTMVDKDMDEALEYEKELFNTHDDQKE